MEENEKEEGNINMEGEKLEGVRADGVMSSYWIRLQNREAYKSGYILDKLLEILTLY